MAGKKEKEPQSKTPEYEVKFDDRTATFERDILKENPPKLRYLPRLFSYVFSSAKVMCGIFLGLSIALSILQPITALIWGRYIDRANALAESGTFNMTTLLSIVGLALIY